MNNWLTESHMIEAMSQFTRDDTETIRVMARVSIEGDRSLTQAEGVEILRLATEARDHIRELVRVSRNLSRRKKPLP
jgi:hypothetical protein